MKFIPGVRDVKSIYNTLNDGDKISFNMYGTTQQGTVSYVYPASSKGAYIEVRTEADDFLELYCWWGNNMSGADANNNKIFQTITKIS